MARPEEYGLKYFSFDVDFFTDEKIEAISGEFGIKGEIAAIKLLCAVYRNGYFIEWNEMLKMKLLRNLPGVSPELLDQIINRLVKWGFFDEHLFNSVKILTSRGIQKRYFEAVKRRKLSCELPYILVNATKCTINVDNNHASTTINVNNNPTNKSKVNNIPPISPLVDPNEYVELSKLKDHVINFEQAWYENIAMNRRLSPGSIIKWLETFFSEQEMNGETERSLKDIKKHFNNWLRNQLDNDRKEIKNATDDRVY